MSNLDDHAPDGYYPHWDEDTSKAQEASISTQLEELLDEIYQDKNMLGDFPIDRGLAKQLLMAWNKATVIEELRKLNVTDATTKCCTVHHKLVDRIKALNKQGERHGSI